MDSRQQHWQGVYVEKEEETLPWFQASPDASLAMVEGTGFGPEARILDVGAGSSRLVDALLDRKFKNLTVLDVSDTGLKQARDRLGPGAEAVSWVTADITTWDPPDTFDIWHDRAAYHFLVDEKDRAAYGRVLEKALAPGGQAIIGTFALDGPERCSGLPVRRYDGDNLARELGPAFRLAETTRDDHMTPKGNIQRFQFSRFTRA